MLKIKTNCYLPRLNVLFLNFKQLALMYNTYVRENYFRITLSCNTKYNKNLASFQILYLKCILNKIRITFQRT